MEARQVAALPEGDGWQFEPKWDGFRCIAVKGEGEVHLISKSGRPLGRYFPDVAAALIALQPKRFIIDGELAIPIGAALSFEALQLRLHPAASRVQKLSRETPAIFILFDILAAGRENLADAPLSVRREALEKFLEGHGAKTLLRLSPTTTRRAEAQAWLKRAGGGALDGVIAKRRDQPYRPGERAMLKVKCLRSADCVVGGFRYATGSNQVGSLLLGLYDNEGKLNHVGFTSGIKHDARAALTKKLKPLIGGSGFTGDAPGGPSRWSTERTGAWVALKPRLIAEVQYDHVSGGRFRHGTRFLRWRPDKAPKQCTEDQLMLEARPNVLMKKVIGARTKNSPQLSSPGRARARRG
jgi:ATP-dependent DNA ligase